MHPLQVAFSPFLFLTRTNYELLLLQSRGRLRNPFYLRKYAANQFWACHVITIPFGHWHSTQSILKCLSHSKNLGWSEIWLHLRANDNLPCGPYLKWRPGHRRVPSKQQCHCWKGGNEEICSYHILLSTFSGHVPVSMLDTWVCTIFYDLWTPQGWVISLVTCSLRLALLGQNNADLGTTATCPFGCTEEICFYPLAKSDWCFSCDY